MATFDEFYRSLPEDSNKRGDYFEKVFIPWFLRTDPEWSTKVKEIWTWDQYPDRWGKDCGIDLVYEDTQGKHWAVQSKCISPDREISKAEVDSFLSESNDSRIYGRLLIASTDGIGKNALQVIERQEKQVVCFLRDHFRQSEVEFPASPEDLSTGRRKDKRRPRPHQQEAIQNVVEGLQAADRGQLLMACGTGKTLTSLWIKEALNARRTLVLLPSLSLLSQTLREWTSASREEFNWICVCSDKSVAKQDKTDDNWIEHVIELGVPVTSDPTEIRSFLLDNEEGIVFSTYQSSPLVAEAQQSAVIPVFDIAFADEAHRCAGKVSPAFGCILDSQKIRAEKRLFMTATPRVLSNRIKSRAEAEDIEVASMDDEDQFGRILHRLNFSEAIERDLLTDYRVVVVGVDDPSIQAKIINRTLSSTGTGVVTDYETLANHISLSKSVRDYNLQRIITFHGRIKAAKKFSEDHPGIVDWLEESAKTARRIKTGYVSGEMTSLERNNKISQLRNLEEDETGILSNARCLSEGVDVPTLDGIAFIDPRSSQVDIIQAVGRAIRKSESKSFGYIILPVYLGNTKNINEELLASRFKDIWEIILALKSQDDALTETLDQLRIELGKRGEKASHAEGLTKIIFDLPERVQSAIGDSLNTMLVKNTTENWHEMYGLMQSYWTENSCLPTGKNKSPFRGVELGTWISRQRANRRGMPAYRKNLLEELDYWTWDGREAEWNKSIHALHNRALMNGGRLPRAMQRDSLWKWVLVQRTLYKKGELPEKRKRLLDEIPGWTWNYYDTTWQEGIDSLQRFYDKHRHVLVPAKYKDDEGFSLGAWVAARRSEHRKESLESSRVEELESISGWCWSPHEEKWEKGFQRLRKYASAEGRVPPLRYKDEDGFCLGSWVQKQRLEWSMLEEAKKIRLSSIKEWEQMLRAH